MFALRDRIESHIAGLEGVTSVWDDWGEWSKKLVLDVDQYRAKNAGLSSEDIAVTLYGHFSGLQVSEYRQEEDIIPIVLRVQFNSLRRVGVILLTLPPAMIGVVAGMLLTNSPFGFMALLGMISLVGIIVNNAIMMIDQIEIERETEDNALQAVLEAAKMRLRPIVMTACTTILGLLPLALHGGELWRPMANVLMFGLAFSTLLTLLLCPVLYVLVFRINPKSR